MSDLTTSTVQDTFREACIQTLGAVQRAGHAVAKRVNDPTGQTAAEYMGILLLISAILVAIFTLHLDNTIKDAVKGAIDGIINGAKAPAAPAGGN
jgi:Flp pilus assembly pilin Flp